MYRTIRHTEKKSHCTDEERTLRNVNHKITPALSNVGRKILTMMDEETQRWQTTRVSLEWTKLTILI